MSRPRWSVLFEDNHLLVVSKPAGLATMGVACDERSLWQAARQYLKEKYHKPGNVYLGVVSRLDADVSGAVVFARTSKAAARLNEQFRQREVEKVYWAVVERMPEEPAGQLEDWLTKNDRRQRMEVTRPGTPGAQLAVLGYRVRRTVSVGVLLEVRLETGRKHQIRVQLAHHLSPIVGDRKYGSQYASPQGMAPHARRLCFLHPVRKCGLCDGSLASILAQVVREGVKGPMRCM